MLFNAWTRSKQPVEPFFQTERANITIDDVKKRLICKCRRVPKWKLLEDGKKINLAFSLSNCYSEYFTQVIHQGSIFQFSNIPRWIHRMRLKAIKLKSTFLPRKYSSIHPSFFLSSNNLCIFISNMYENKINWLFNVWRKRYWKIDHIFKRLFSFFLQYCLSSLIV